MDKAYDARQIFANNLKRMLKLRGHDQVDLAAYMNVSSSTASDWCTGKKYPRVDNVQKLADWLGVVKSDLTEEKIDSSMILPTGMVPILGQIPAGVPILAEENLEGYLPTMLKNPDEYFYLRVKGESMINAGIKTGDLVLIHKQNSADNGDIVACRVNGDEATLKRFNQNKNMVMLTPENPAYSPILIECNQFNEGYAEIIGIAKQVIKNL